MYYIIRLRLTSICWKVLFPRYVQHKHKHHDFFPTGPFTIFRASRSGDRRILSSSEIFCHRFWSSKIAKGLVGFCCLCLQRVYGLSFRLACCSCPAHLKSLLQAVRSSRQLPIATTYDGRIDSAEKREEEKERRTYVYATNMTFIVLGRRTKEKLAHRR